MKRGAMELSIGTIVIIVLAMSMLILGLVLVKNIFSSSNNAIDLTDDQLQDQINKLFVEDRRTVVYLPNQIAKIEQNEDWGVAFGVKNLEKGTAETGQFSYEISVNDPDIKQKCGIDERTVETTWIVAGRAGSMDINPGEAYAGIVRFFIPENSPLCVVRLNIEIKKDNQHYATDFFDVEVVA